MSYKTHGSISFGLREDETGQVQPLDQVLNSLVTDELAKPAGGAAVAGASKAWRGLTDEVASRLDAWLSMREVHVEEYGAIGDNTVDDTAAINKAVSGLGPRGGRVLFGPKRYRHTTSIISDTGPVFLRGQVSSHAGSGAGSCLSSAITDGTPTLLFSTGGGIDGLGIIGNGGNTIGLQIGQTSGFSVYNTWIYNCANSGLFVDYDTFDLDFFNLWVHTCGSITNSQAAALVKSQTSDTINRIRFIACKFEAYKYYALHMQRVSTFQVQQCDILACKFHYDSSNPGGGAGFNSKKAIVLENCGSINIFGGDIHGTWEDGVYVTAGSNVHINGTSLTSTNLGGSGFDFNFNGSGTAAHHIDGAYAGKTINLGTGQIVQGGNGTRDMVATFDTPTGNGTGGKFIRPSPTCQDYTRGGVYRRAGTGGSDVALSSLAAYIGQVQLTTAGTSANGYTLPAGTHGQQIQVILSVKGSTGSAVLKPDSGVTIVTLSEGAVATVTFDTVGKYAVLVYEVDRWRILRTTGTVA